MKIEFKKIILIIFVCSFSSCFAQSKLEQNNSLVTKIPFTTNATIKYHLGTYGSIARYRFYVDSISLEDKEKLKKLSVEEWRTLLEHEETDWAANILLHYIFDKDVEWIYISVTTRDKWILFLKNEEITYWSAFLQQNPRIWKEPEYPIDSTRFKGKMNVQSPSSICLQNKSFNLEVVLATPPNDSIAITIRFTNRSNKIIGIDDNHTSFCAEDSQELNLYGHIYKDYHTYDNDFYCGVRCIPPGEYVLFTVKAVAPPYNKVINLRLSYLLDIAFLVEKKIVLPSANAKERACYSYVGNPNFKYLDKIILEFTKDSKEVYVEIPKDCTLCKPTLTPTKD